jgi:hypothetical protein
MEYRKPQEIASQLLESRDELRTDLALETALIERINELPEEDFCHDARLNLQLGAGYAHVRRNEETSLDEVFATFFATQPQFRYLNQDVIEVQRQTVVEAVLSLMSGSEMPQLEDHIDVYQIEACAAFVEGYLLAERVLHTQPNETEAA